MKEIFVLRHGIAEDISESVKKDDLSRKLTPEGRKKINRLSIFFNNLEENIDTILTSPYLRAKETAEIFISNLHPKPEFKTVDFLAVGVSLNEISQGLLPFLMKEKILLVGHAPDLEILTGQLTGVENIKLKKGALAKITLNNSIKLSGRLEWLVTSKIIKNIK